MSENPQQVSEWLDLIFSYGTFWVYLILFAACFIENIFPPFPGDSFIAAAGGLVALGKLSLGLSFFLALAGALVLLAVISIWRVLTVPALPPEYKIQSTLHIATNPVGTVLHAEEGEAAKEEAAREVAARDSEDAPEQS